MFFVFLIVGCAFAGWAYETFSDLGRCWLWKILSVIYLSLVGSRALAIADGVSTMEVIGFLVTVALWLRCCFLAQVYHNKTHTLSPLFERIAEENEKK
jgi:hypothetical protein